ncbi:MAG: hypothetical protein ABEJ44_02950 [Halanaeroarchaeum sp.]
MRLPETRDLFVRELDFPVSHDTVVESLGEHTLEAPSGEDESIADVLARVQTEEFEHADELYDALLTYVSDAFIGRKFYDDRGGKAPVAEDDEGVHF